MDNALRKDGGRISDPAQIRRVPLGVAAFSKRRFEKKTGEAAHFAAKSRARRSGDLRYSREPRRSTPECYLRRIGDAPKDGRGGFPRLR